MAANASQLALLADHIKLSLLERERALSLKLETDTQNAEIARSLESFRSSLQALEDGQGPEDLDNLRQQYTDLQNQFDGVISAHSNITKSPNDRALASDFAAATTRPSKSVRFNDNTDSEADDAARANLFNRPYQDDPSRLNDSYSDDPADPPDHSNLDNQQIHAYHSQVIAEQDQQLDVLSGSVRRIGDLSIHIGNELDEQNVLIDDVDEGVTRHQGSLDRARDRVGRIARKAKDNWSITTIAVLNEDMTYVLHVSYCTGLRISLSISRNNISHVSRLLWNSIRRRMDLFSVLAPVTVVIGSAASCKLLVGAHDALYTTLRNLSLPSAELAHSMVLDEASPTGSAVTDDIPYSDADPYASPSSTPSPNGPGLGEYRLDMSQLPKGLPLLGPLFGFTPQRLLNVIVLDSARVKAIAGRPLTQPEFDAISYHCAKMNAISSYGAPVGIAGGIWRAQNSRKTFRFPFWQPEYNPDKPHQEGKFDPSRFGPLKGAQAHAAWHAMRRMSFALIGGAVGMALFNSYATTVAIAGQRTDNRMKDIMSTLQSMTPEERRYRAEQASREVRGQMNRPQQGVQLQGRGRQEQTQSQGYEQVVDATEASSIDQQTPHEPSDQRQRPQSSQQYSVPTRQRQSQSAEFDFDDASPQRSTPSSPSSSDPWETLRQNARNGVQYQGPQGPGSGSAWIGKRGSQADGLQNQQRQSTAVGDSFSFSKSDEERQLAKEEAQREFDARIDRERQGQDFNSDANKRWK
ncbi:hypothetical protein FH972_022528 [Carpinus fangiana]|uniref:t-SNARE coiled-coil homology domain-containing protein n=1 Tax=Carpinus fangiana TaxID=176857 RepID=A0A5N6KT22_9ROSI|nr:hypothetical protein FH972_022528 [Carpinus fangiana]